MIPQILTVNGKQSKNRKFHYPRYEIKVEVERDPLTVRAPQGPVDLQLPKIKFNQPRVPVVAASSTSEPKIRFAEKTAATATPITSFVKREPGESEFKKRKIDDAKKNLRARGDKDE